MATVESLHVNGVVRALQTDGARPLLDVLREDLQLTGSKYGCGEGQCGACTVLVDGKPVRSCITPVESVAAKAIRTIEGLENEGNLHPVQEAFIREEAMQCGYCVPGMILSAVALLEATPKPSEGEIVRALDGNLCRCCGYPNIVRAVLSASGQSKPQPR